MTASTEDNRPKKRVTIPFTPWNPEAAHLLTPQQKLADRTEKKPARVPPSERLTAPLRDVLQHYPGVHTPKIPEILRKRHDIEANAERVRHVLYAMRSRGEATSEPDMSIRPITDRWWLAKA
ncbi:hypothetical protein DL1_08650 [Thioclava dalianensis]|uniref:Uncharacterized protein n=1 Tax=Thioclava dalianensis TaxID=1185766 RepID=A0A074TFB3_9RHOB|nr:hypothetical protein [Thioclava dalianensis]KEP68830.1 hypothetical protein DL1_08650 [Thioclava dalianensis]SFN49378.1 hypothetical protein SAMN05216224_10659 [Thioclava dalianensis]